MDLRWLTLLLAVVATLRQCSLALPPPLCAFEAFSVWDLEAHLEAPGPQVYVSGFFPHWPLLSLFVP